ncbi:hypothetical protein NPIL_587201 [Nephila pilipes]|uniref:Uncharacterized protein n=1 Tax=Nephila pilipes TaxID=299642 RepID=A0A8X6TI41_NEPPI|nr:hypothetical protein NPIL_587201 [Nephila pilipes]
MTYHRYVNDVLLLVTLGFIQELPNVIYQQNNTKLSKIFINQYALEGAWVFFGPPVTSELSPIAHVWNLFQRRVRSLPPTHSEDDFY